jgi:hypothetical protein
MSDHNQAERAAFITAYRLWTREAHPNAHPEMVQFQAESHWGRAAGAMWLAARRAPAVGEDGLPAMPLLNKGTREQQLQAVARAGCDDLIRLHEALGFADDDMIDADKMIERIADLRAEVREWLCMSCNTVYPGPPQAGFACVMCPKCKGTTGPRGFVERRVLERKIEDLRAQLARQSQPVHQVKSMIHPHGWYDCSEAESAANALAGFKTRTLYAAPTLPTAPQHASQKGEEP